MGDYSAVSLQTNSYQNPWDKWNAAYSKYQPKVSYGGENGSSGTEKVNPLSTNFFINPTLSYTGSVGGFGNVQDDHKPTYAMHDTTYTTGDPRLAHDRHDFMLFA